MASVGPSIEERNTADAGNGRNHVVKKEGDKGQQYPEKWGVGC
jgi:hypothetical protein